MCMETHINDWNQVRTAYHVARLGTVNAAAKILTNSLLFNILHNLSYFLQNPPYCLVNYENGLFLGDIK